ncbi:MAG TPA: BTAD domain-containing putative transcriptional regulator [Actinomycetota bacterium]|nr:BTAD domain-containing putative transcriptional regulator [Actinomycetota bacterium]
MEQRLRVRVLGATELAVDGRPVAGLASAKATALLVHLAVTGTARSRSALAGLLWSDLPEETARANLRLALTKLRRALPEQLLVTRQSVALDPARPVWVDAVEVARLAAVRPEGEELLAGARLCRGELLAGFEVQGAELFDEWVLGRRAAARADQLALLERAVEDARERRDTAAGVEVARRMLELEPLHEEAHRALMWFLATGGQRGAALAQFETCRYLLREELGEEPSAAAVALRDQIAQAGGFADLGPAPAGAGAAAAGAAAAPRPLTSLIGREEDLARLHALLDDPACRLVTLVGPGGIGKTRLALEAGATRRGRYRDGVLTVSFVGTSPARPEEAADLVVTNLAAALGVSLAVPRDPAELLADHLAGQELLLILDNLEQLRDAAGVLAELLTRAPGVQMLGTSRRRLGLGAEWLVEVSGLPYPPAGAEADAAGYAAVQLFEERARLLRSGFRPAADLAGVARVCRLVAGVPLAIELASRWVRSASPAAIADRLAAGGELLETTAPDVEPRHRSIRSVIDWSWELLGASERQALARLSVLRGGFDLDAAAAVAGAGLPLLAGLVDHSLVEAEEDGRYGMHELLRQDAAQRLAADPADEHEVRRRHAAWFSGLLPDPDRPPAAAVDLDADVENLRAATDWLVTNADPAELDRHLERLWQQYRRKGWFREAQAVFAAALRRGEVPAPLRAHWHRLLAAAHMELGEMGPAREHFERALALLGNRLPTSTLGWSEMLGSQVLRWPLRRLRPGSPVERHRDRRERAAESAAVCYQLQEACWMLEDQAPLIPMALWALDLSERAGRADLMMMNQAGLGNSLTAGGLHRLARRQVRAAAAAAGRTTDPMAVTWTQVVASLHWIGVGDWAALDAGLPRALEVGRAAGLHRMVDQLLLLGGVSRYLTGRFEEAAAMSDEALAAGRDRRDPQVQLWSLLVLAESRLRTDPGDPALTGIVEEAEPLLAGGVPTIDAVRFHVAAARLRLAGGRTADAWRSIRAAAALGGPERSFHPYTIEAHAGVPEVCRALLEQDEPPGADPAELRATATAGLRRLHRYGRAFPMARPRGLLDAGSWHRLEGRPRQAARSWARAVQAAERLAMPYELARAHLELGRQLAGTERSPLGLDRSGHLERAAAGFAALGCRADLAAVQAVTSSGPASPLGRTGSG